MWFADGAYTPVTYLGGLWSPVGELTATVQQGQITDATEMAKYGIFTNRYWISDCLYNKKRKLNKILSHCSLTVIYS
jgi:hypothetical protein